MRYTPQPRHPATGRFVAVPYVIQGSEEARDIARRWGPASVWMAWGENPFSRFARCLYFDMDGVPVAFWYATGACSRVPENYWRADGRRGR